MKNRIDEMDNLEFNEDDIFKDLVKKNIPKSEQDAKSKEKYIDKNLQSKLKKIANNIKLVRNIVALYRYLKSPKVSAAKKGIVIAGLLYFILPLDAIPDFIPIAGFLDDIGVVTALVNYLGKELEKFY